MKDEKKAIRNTVLSCLHMMDHEGHREYSNKIASTLYQQEEWVNAKNVGITISRAPELDTKPIIEKAWKQGKIVTVPKCLPKNNEMQFRRLQSFDQLETVYYGLSEPIVSETQYIPQEQIDLLIVPGVAYIPQGYRVGFGGGYYDRFLANYSGIAISLAFREQIVENVPIEAHDIPVSKIITPERIFICNEL
ncbi:5-formyltetrahydrofolate cyclo-ligase [Peribacillus sp. SCS-155]|uniref:5-formyltetrahydrofolate cyclo-ligase n=1 Tax=Peribacillus sedimenti TaxID=3115297 RepID=UPI0039062B79